MKFHIMSEWKTYKLGDLIECIIDNRGKSAPISISNYQPIIEINALGQREVNYDVIRKYVSKETYDTWFRAGHPKIGDILFSTVGTIGLTSLMTQDVGCIAQNIIALRVNDKLLNNQYLYYFLNNKTTKINLNNLNIGGVQPSIKLPHLLNMPISLPPLTEQKRIADILSAIDDKIELNRRINANLEQQAQALYKSWFVDNKKDDWKEVPLSEVADFVGGYSYKGNELVESSMTAMATIKNFERKGGFKVDGFKDIVASNKLKAEHHANLFDILVAHTDLTQNADVIGNAEMLLTFDKYSDIIFSMDLVKVLPKQTFPYKYLLAALLKNSHFKKHCMGYVNGTTVLHMSKKALPEYIVNLPSIEEIQSMDNAFKAYYLKMAEILQENNSLSTLRDTLLPKLMGGEIKV